MANDPSVTDSHDPASTCDCRECAIAERNELRAALASATTRYERGAHCLMEMMLCYERRIRSDCRSQAEIDRRPWESMEYLAGAEFLRAMWPTEVRAALISGPDDAARGGK